MQDPLLLPVWQDLQNGGLFMKVSLCVVAYNEERYLPGMFENIKAQTYPHNKIEIVFVDSCSSDDTKKKMLAFQQEYQGEFESIHVLDNPGKILSCGWNEALTHFSGDMIVRVDAHSQIPPEFVENNVRVLESGEDVCGGVRPTIVEDDSDWSATLHLAEESMFGSSVSSYRRSTGRTYEKSVFHGAYRRKVFEKIGGYREDLGRTEDNEIHYRMRKNGFRICMSPEIISYQYIRPTLGKMCRQKYGNGYWIGLTAGVCPGCLSLFHFVPGAFILGIVFTSILGGLGFPWLSVAMWSVYWLLAVVMAVVAVHGQKKTASDLLLPFLFFLLHISYGVGTIAGLCKMPFFRKGHRDCESVERVKRILEEKRAHRDEK